MSFLTKAGPGRVAAKLLRRLDRPERERLYQTFIRFLERLIELLEDEGDDPAAIRYAQRLLRHDEVHEVTYRRLTGSCKARYPAGGAWCS